MFAGNFAPRGYALCDGQLLAVSQNDALFSLFGTIYGGDGRTTFGLPDRRGRVPVRQGQGPALSNRRLGAKGGQENVTLAANNVPNHTHDLQAAGQGTTASPSSVVRGHLGISEGGDSPTSSTACRGSPASRGTCCASNQWPWGSEGDCEPDDYSC